jgi:hypothetical protein
VSEECLDKHIISATVVMSRNNMRVVGSGVAAQSGATTMEHMICHQHQQRNGVFCWVHAGATYGELKHKPVSLS